MQLLHESPVIWVTAGASLALQTASTVLNAIFAFSLHDFKLALQVLAFVDFAINCLCIFPLAYLITYYLPKLRNGSLNSNNAFCRRFLGMSLCTLAIAVSFSLATLVWASVKVEDLTERMAGQPSRVLAIVWFSTWGVATLLQIFTYSFIARWTIKGTRSHSPASLDIDFGMRTPPEMQEEAPVPRPTSESFRSQDPTLASPPRTPSTVGLSSPFRLSHSAGKGGPTSSRTRLMHANSFTQDSSAKSSFDYPSRDAVSVNHPFDSWDTSGVPREIRTTMHPTPPVTRSGLETIPGSRPDSPAKTLDGPFLPSPQPDSSEVANAIERVMSDSSPKAASSPPPSSPPNFSRPTSRHTTQPVMSGGIDQSASETSMENLIHPLFRSTSPHPAPVPRLGTMVSASPLAGQSITPRVLGRIRSTSMPQAPIPSSLEPTHTHTGSNTGTIGFGSPGPSVLDDEELPIVLPGFVLSAGQRDSIVGYDKRKSIKERPASFHSQGDRLSSLLM